MKRELGFYWVNYDEIWQVAKYANVEGLGFVWILEGSIALKESDFHLIGKKLEMPCLT